MKLPLVSIGIPVRNGGVLLSTALEQLVSQTHTNLEIIISDNNSSDETAEICTRYKNSDSRIKYFRHLEELTALENFRFVVEKANADYFMWAAHDDRHTLNYVEVLLREMLKNNKASLVFSDVTIFNDFSQWEKPAPINYDFISDIDESLCRKIITRSYIRSGYLHVYGLIRRQFLIEYNWINIDIGPDRPMLFYLSCRGVFSKAEGACFYCYKPERKKTKEFRKKTYFRGETRLFPYTRLSWACARAGNHAEKLEGRNRSTFLMFFLFYGNEVKKKLRVCIGKMRRIFK